MKGYCLFSPLKYFFETALRTHTVGKLLCQIYRDVPDPDSTIRYPVKCRHPALSGIRVKFAGYLPDSTVTYFITNIKWKT